MANYYQSIIGVLNWVVEIGRVDIITEVSKLASAMAMPREGHLDAAFHVFGYLSNHHNSRMVFDPSYPDIDSRDFIKSEWKDFYAESEEPIPTDIPRPLGKDVDVRCFVDSDHASDKKTRKSRTGYFFYINCALVAWKSSKQKTVETSAFGSEFVAMKHAMEYNRGLRFKLRMMGVPLSGATYFYGDNMSVINNVTRPESTLKKKSNSICYHAVREAVAMGELIAAHVSSKENPADLATKTGHTSAVREHLVEKLLYNVYDAA